MTKTLSSASHIEAMIRVAEDGIAEVRRVVPASGEMPAPMNAARPYVGEVVYAFGTMRDAVTAFADRYIATWANPDLTAEARDRIIAADRAATVAVNTDALAKMQDAVAQLRDVMRALLFPRPVSIDSVEMSRRQSMLTGALDRLDPPAVISRMAKELTRALTGGDQVTSWLLTGDDFPRLYLEARGLGHLDEVWQDVVTGAVRSVCNEETRGAFAVLALIDGTRGFNAIVQASCQIAYRIERA